MLVADAVVFVIWLIFERTRQRSDFLSGPVLVCMSGDDDDDDDEVCFPCNKHGRVNTSHRFCNKRNGGMHNTEGVTREYTQNTAL
jgi:hypothetical protein